MKLTKSKLKRLIKEELENALYEEKGPPSPGSYEAVGIDVHRLQKVSGMLADIEGDALKMSRRVEGIVSALLGDAEVTPRISALAKSFRKYAEDVYGDAQYARRAVDKLARKARYSGMERGPEDPPERGGGGVVPVSGPGRALP